MANHTNKRFGMLVVLGRAPRASTSNGNARWSCRCDCGSLTEADSWQLTRSQRTSCGCGTGRHGHCRGGKHSSVYDTWRSMIRRCENPKSKDYSSYGGRGIRVCDRWKTSFENFLADMGDKPASHLSLDRINNDRGYEPGNCRWATPSQQANNQRSTRFITAFGRRQSMTEWSAETGLARRTIRHRANAGWKEEDIVSTPVLARNSKGAKR